MEVGSRHAQRRSTMRSVSLHGERTPFCSVSLLSESTVAVGTSLVCCRATTLRSKTGSTSTRTKELISIPSGQREREKTQFLYDGFDFSLQEVSLFPPTVVSDDPWTKSVTETFARHSVIRVQTIDEVFS